VVSASLVYAPTVSALPASMRLGASPEVAVCVKLEPANTTDTFDTEVSWGEGGEIFERWWVGLRARVRYVG